VALYGSTTVSDTYNKRKKDHILLQCEEQSGYQVEQQAEMKSATPAWSASYCITTSF